MTADEDIIRLEKIDIIQLALLNRLDIMFSNIAFALSYDSKFISFGQLKEAEILYDNHLKNIIFKKTENIISLIQNKKNHYILDLENNTNKIMITQKKS